MASAPPQKPVNFPDMINRVQEKLDSMGPGPYTDKQKEEIKALQLLLAKARQENQKTPLPPGTAAMYQTAPVRQQAADTGSDEGGKILDRKRLQDLVREVDSHTQLEDDVEEVLMQIADDFIDNVVSASCELAKHRHSDTLETRDVLTYLERGWNMWIPGFSSDEIRPYKKPATAEAHKQRMGLIKKTLKKY